MVEPSELLEDLGVFGVLHQDPLIGLPRETELLLLLVHVTDLEPDVDLGERFRRTGENVPEALQAGGELLLLLVDDTEAEVDFISFFEVWGYFDDTCEGFLGMFEAAVSVVENADAIPQFRIL